MGGVAVALAALFIAAGMTTGRELTLDASAPTPVPDAWLKLGGERPGGPRLGINDQYLTRDGRPWLPIMGEFHYARYPALEWDRELAKMHAAGLSIVSTYALWVNHEPSRGQWRWDGDEDLARFVRLCARRGLLVWLRVGPYCNAEARNGGFPDYVAAMAKKRCDDAAYLAEVERWYEQVGQQVQGLRFADGGPIIGLQIENEFAYGEPQHIDTLRRLAQRHGLDAPYWTVTANTRFNWREGLLWPLQGAYPYRGWGPLGEPTQDFMYRSEAWGAMFNEYGAYYDLSRFPVGFCEMGAGCWCSYENRFQVPGGHAEALLQDTLGRGSTMVGYYMFHGGTQRAGTEMAGHPLSYDFQAPLGEFGQRHESYARLKLLHHFINDFGAELADGVVVRPELHPATPTDTTTPRFVGRLRDGRGFVFANNAQAWVPMVDQADLRFDLRLPGGRQLAFPRTPFTLAAQSYVIWPVNLDLAGARLVHANCQPLARFDDNGTTYVFLFAHAGIAPELAFAADTVAHLDAGRAAVAREDGLLLARPTPGLDSALRLTARDGRKLVVMTLTRAQAESSWRVRWGGRERLILTTAGLAQDGESLVLSQVGEPRMSLRSCPSSRPGDLFDTRYLAVPTVACQPLPQRDAPNRWSFTLAGLPAGADDVWVEVDLVGRDAALLVDGTHVTDLRPNGQPWRIGLRRWLSDQRERRFTVVVAPWDDRVRGLPPAALPRDEAERAGAVRAMRFAVEYRAVLPAR